METDIDFNCWKEPLQELVLTQDELDAQMVKTLLTNMVDASVVGYDITKCELVSVNLII